MAQKVKRALRRHSPAVLAAATAIRERRARLRRRWEDLSLEERERRLLERP